MHITISSLHDFTDGPFVEFVSKYGTGRGHWKEGVPHTGQEYDIELGLDDALRVGVNIQLTNDESPRIHSSDEQTVFTARIAEVFDNDTANLQLGESLILVEFEGDFPNPGTWLEITVKRIELWDTRY